MVRQYIMLGGSYDRPISLMEDFKFTCHLPSLRQYKNVSKPTGNFLLNYLAPHHQIDIHAVHLLRHGAEENNHWSM